MNDNITIQPAEVDVFVTDEVCKSCEDIKSFMI